nr:hypothetical protein [Bradyrhizobium australiense]
MGGALFDRLQQSALVGVDRCPLQVDAILSVERFIAAFAAFGCNDVVGQFELAHFHNRRADRSLERRPCGEAESKTGTVRPAGDGRDAGHADIRRNVEQPSPARRRDAVPKLLQQVCRHDAGFRLRRKRSRQLTASPPQAGCIALDQFQQAMQRCGVP